jgi:AcrR family transcriptional regulator
MAATAGPATRRYRSETRAQQAGRTRERILEAARDLFLEEGFARTTINTVAERAGVSVETVYATYRSKPRLLGEVIRAAVRRGAEPEDPLERGWVKTLLTLPDLDRRLESFAVHTAETLRLTSPLHVVIRDAGTGAAELSELDRDLRELRYGDQAKIMQAIARGGGLAAGTSASQAAETFSALASPELHNVLTDGRGWSEKRYARWLVRTLKSTLLPSNGEML